MRRIGVLSDGQEARWKVSECADLSTGHEWLQGALDRSAPISHIHSEGRAVTLPVPAWQIGQHKLRKRPTSLLKLRPLSIVNLDALVHKSISSQVVADLA